MRMLPNVHHCAGCEHFTRFSRMHRSPQCQQNISLWADENHAPNCWFGSQETCSRCRKGEIGQAGQVECSESRDLPFLPSVGCKDFIRRPICCETCEHSGGLDDDLRCDYEGTEGMGWDATTQNGTACRFHSVPPDGQEPIDGHESIDDQVTCPTCGLRSVSSTAGILQCPEGHTWRVRDGLRVAAEEEEMATESVRVEVSPVRCPMCGGLAVSASAGRFACSEGHEWQSVQPRRVLYADEKYCAYCVFARRNAEYELVECYRRAEVAEFPVQSGGSCSGFFHQLCQSCTHGEWDRNRLRGGDCAATCIHPDWAGPCDHDETVCNSWRDAFRPGPKPELPQPPPPPQIDPEPTEFAAPTKCSPMGLAEEERIKLLWLREAVSRAQDTRGPEWRTHVVDYLITSMGLGTPTNPAAVIVAIDIQLQGTTHVIDVTCWAWHPSRLILATGHEDGKTRVWEWMPESQYLDRKGPAHSGVREEGAVTSVWWAGPGGEELHWRYQRGVNYLLRQKECDGDFKARPPSSVSSGGKWVVVQTAHGLRVEEWKTE